MQYVKSNVSVLNDRPDERNAIDVREWRQIPYREWAGKYVLVTEKKTFSEAMGFKWCDVATSYRRTAIRKWGVPGFVLQNFLLGE